MDSTMESLLETYLFETNSLLDGLDELLINAEKDGNFSEDNVNEIFRSMHTIKGSSAMLEFNSLMEIAHHIEDLFFYIRENGIDSLSEEHKKELFNIMFDSTDKLREEIQKVENNEPLETDIDNFVSEINGLLNKISGKASDNEAAAPADTATSPEASGIHAFPESDAPYFLHVRFEDGCGMENLRAFMLVNSMHEIGLEFSYYPEDVDTNSETAEKIVEDGFFIGLHTDEDLEQAAKIVDGSPNIHSYEMMENPAHVTDEPVSDAPVADVSVPEGGDSAENTAESSKVSSDQTEKNSQEKKPAPAKKGTTHGAVKQDLISVNLSKLDALMNIVSEIVITEAMVTSSPDLQGLKLDNFMKSARQLRKLTDDLQDISMSLRMVSVSGVFQRMNRIVRDMRQTLNKDVRLTIVGENTEVDKTIVDSIGDPIMHIVRNSMDHGIEENVQDRIARGKDPQAEIILSATHTGSEVIISVSDDGRGMDPDAILAKAAANGILTKPAEAYSQKEILMLLMTPGFSTKTEVSEFSGRGVGLDVVKKNVEACGGTISITSELGKGSTTTLKIPLTLAIVDGMEIAVGNSLFTIPLANIRQSFKVTQADIIYDPSGHEMVKCRDEFYPVIRLYELYSTPDAKTDIEDGILMWVEASDKSYCLFVDRLIGEHQIVVKPLPLYLQQFTIKDSGICGCTILGDGNISIILDVASVYAAAQGIL